MQMRYNLFHQKRAIHFSTGLPSVLNLRNVFV